MLVITWVLSADLQCFVPHETVDSEFGDPMKFDEVTFSLLVKKRKCVDAEALHHSIRTWNASIGHGPHDHVRC